jgi:hypothetical protein
MPMPCFLLCVEAGRLEPQSLLCVESLRVWGGALASAPVYAFSPRPDHAPAPATVSALAELDVVHVDEPLNPAHGDLPHTNKAYCCGWAERELDHHTLVFVDSDTAFLGEPAELAAGDWDAAVRPVGETNAGSTGEGHRNEAAWEDVYAELGVQARPFVETVVTRERIRGYFNAGLVAARRDAGVMSAWEDAIERLFDSQVVDRRRKFRSQLDQLALAGVLADRFDRVRLLPDTYNYPLPKRILLPEPMRELALDELVHVHGHRWLHLPGLLGELSPRLDPSGERYRWLDERLPLEPTIDEPFRFPAPD